MPTCLPSGGESSVLATWRQRSCVFPVQLLSGKVAMVVTSTKYLHPRGGLKLKSCVTGIICITVG